MHCSLTWYPFTLCLISCTFWPQNWFGSKSKIWGTQWEYVIRFSEFFSPIAFSCVVGVMDKRCVFHVPIFTTVSVQSLNLLPARGSHCYTPSPQESIAYHFDNISTSNLQQISIVSFQLAPKMQVHTCEPTVGRSLLPELEPFYSSTVATENLPLSEHCSDHVKIRVSVSFP